MNFKQTDKQYIMNTYNRFDVVIKGGKGSTLIDENNKEFIDFGSGIAVNIFGACDEEWKEAVTQQINKIQHTSNLYYSEPCCQLAELLCKKTDMSKVFFSNSGAEANECAIKAARKYGSSIDKDKNVIITLKNSFHGRTVTTLSATGQDVFHQYFDPFTDGFVYVNPDNTDELEKAVKNNNCAAIMIETIQGEGGIKVLSKEFIDKINDICVNNNILLIIDEVQTGNGRTGKMYSYMNFNLKPDIITTAKGLGGGLPIGATIFNKKLDDILTAGMHGSTFGGNPVACAGALSVINRLDDKLFQEVIEKGKYISEKLKGMNGVNSVDGMGLMLGIVTEKPASEIALKALEKGLLVLTAKTKVRLLPALNITYDEIDKGLKILNEIL